MNRRIHTLVLLGIRFFARCDEFRASQPAGRKIVAQCASTGRASVPPQPRNGAEEPLRRSFFRPVPGLANAARLLPTALRRGLLSFALRALRAACRYAGQVANLRTDCQSVPASKARLLTARLEAAQ